MKSIGCVKGGRFPVALSVSDHSLIRLLEIEEVEYLGKYFLTTSGEEIAITNLLIVKLRSTFDIKRMLDETSKRGLEIVQNDKYDETRLC